MRKINTRPFDMVNYLQAQADITEYLSQVLEDGEPAELAAALGDIAKVRHQAQPPKDASLSCESL